MPSLMGSINIIARCARLYRNDKLRAYGIHGTMDSIMLYVSSHPGVSQEEIAGGVCIDKSNVTRKLARLEEKGYVYRTPSEKDRRVTLVYPTEKGMEFRKKILEILQEWSENVLADLTPEQAELVHEGLGIILERAREYVDTREEDGE